MNIHDAVSRGKQKIVENLIKNGCDINQIKDGRAPLHIAAKNGNRLMCHLLIEARANINIRNVNKETPLHVCLKNHHDGDLAKFLVRFRADVNAKDNKNKTPLQYCLNSFNTFKYLIEEGADMYCIHDRSNILITAAGEANPEHIDYILKKGMKINVKNESGVSPLIQAIKSNRFKNFQFLLKAGADINQRAPDGKTPLMIAFSLRNQYAMPLELLKAGANLNIEDYEGNTLLSEAVYSYNYTLVKFLVKLGANVNKKTNQGESLLYAVARKYLVRFVKLFIEAGAEVDATGRNYYSIDDSPPQFTELSGIRSKKILKPLLQIAQDIDMYAYLRSCDNLIEFSNAIKLITTYFILLHPLASQPEDIDLPNDLSEWWVKCQKQVRKMQKYKLGKSHVTLYNYLLEWNYNQRAFYLSENSAGIRSGLEAAKLMPKFSNYAEMIEERLTQDVWRGELLHQWNFNAMEGEFNNVSSSVHFQIGMYLENSNLQILVNSDRREEEESDFSLLDD